MEKSLKPIFQQFYADYDHISMDITAYGVAMVREPELSHGPWELDRPQGSSPCLPPGNFPPVIRKGRSHPKESVIEVLTSTRCQQGFLTFC